jgi:hypothetical protein
MVNTSQFDAKPDEVDHWTLESDWCADCWHWAVDCEHLNEPLHVEHHAVDDAWILRQNVLASSLYESQIETYEHRDNSDVRDQPFPELTFEEHAYLTTSETPTALCQIAYLWHRTWN